MMNNYNIGIKLTESVSLNYNTKCMLEHIWIEYIILFVYIMENQA